MSLDVLDRWSTAAVADDRVDGVARALAGQDEVIPARAFETPHLVIEAARWVSGPEPLPPRHAELYRYWDEARGDRVMPPAEAIDPSRFARMLAHIILLEPLDRGLDARYRVYGSGIARPAGRDWTGVTVKEMTRTVKAGMELYYRAGYRAVVTEGRALYAAHRSPVPLSVSLWRRLILPFGEGPGSVDRLLVLNQPDQRYYQSRAELEEIRHRLGRSLES